MKMGTTGVSKRKGHDLLEWLMMREGMKLIRKIRDEHVFKMMVSKKLKRR